MKKLTIFFSGLLCCISIAAQQRTYSSVQSAAAKFLHSNVIENVASDKSLGAKGTTDTQNADAYYIFNDTENGGFVIISGDERQKEILGYGTSSTFDADNIPDGMKDLLNQYAKEYSYLRDSLPTKVSNTNNKMASSLKYKRTTSDIAVDALVKSRWNQGYPYNMLTPVIDGEHCPTGCGATAMAQVMNYYKYPIHGKGSLAYTPESTGIEISENFANTTFDWNNMSNSYNGTYTYNEANAVAQLMKSCGTAIAMGYDKYSSWSYDVDIVYALINFFNYNANIQAYQRNKYCHEEWIDIINKELEAKRPMIYSGQGSGGHLFVLDGADGLGRYHINWGWGGYADNYFELSSMKPTEWDDFSYDQWMICHITPETTGEEENIFYAEDFYANASTYPLKNGVLSNMSLTITNCWNFSNKTSRILQNQEAWILGVGVFDKDMNLLRTESQTFSNLTMYYGYTFLNFNISNSGIFKEGEVFYFAPVVGHKSGAWTRIRTDQGKADRIRFIVRNGNLIKEDFESFSFTQDGITYLADKENECAFVNYNDSYNGDIVIPEQVTYDGITYSIWGVESYAFSNCTGVTSITLPITTKKIGLNAFSGCSSLKTITCNNPTPPICFTSSTTTPFTGLAISNIYVPEGALQNYKAANGWKTFTSKLSVPSDAEKTSITITNAAFATSILNWNNSTEGEATHVSLYTYGEDDIYNDWNTPSYGYAGILQSVSATPTNGRIYQRKDVGNGVYEFRMTGQAIDAYVYANAARKHIDNGFHDLYKTKVIVTDGHIEYGLMVENCTNRVLNMDNAELFYLGEATEDNTQEAIDQLIESAKYTIGTGKMQKSKRDALDAAISAMQKGGTFAQRMSNYEALSKIAFNASDSKILYERLNYAITSLKEKTNNNTGESIEQAKALIKEIEGNYSNEVYSDEEITGVIAQINEMIYVIDDPRIKNASDQNPVDVSYMIENADFSEGMQSWTESHTIPSPNEWAWAYRNGDVEFYNLNYNLYQTLRHIPNGKYLIKIQGFYRPGSISNAKTIYTSNQRKNFYAKFYGDNGVTNRMSYIQFIGTNAPDYSYDGAVSLSTADGLYIPNDMESGHAYFEDGLYADNYLFVDVVDGVLKIGITKENNVATDWTMITGFNLFYLGKNSEIMAGECSGKYKLTWRTTSPASSNSEMVVPGSPIVWPMMTVIDGKVPNWISVPAVMPEADKTITGTYYYLGDANGDGKIDISDSNTIVDFFVGKITSTSTKIKLNSADYDRDGKVTISDANAIMNIK